MQIRTIRMFAVVASLSLIVGALGTGAAAAKKKPKKKKKPASMCPAYKPVPPGPDSESEQKDKVAKAKVLKVTEAATEAKPLTVELEHGMALWSPTQDPIQEDTEFVGLQIQSKNPSAGLYIRQEWPAPSLSDLDVYLTDKTGEEVAASGSSNVLPMPVDAGGQDTGAQGFESISGFAAAKCGDYVIESRPFNTAGENVTMKVWLGPIEA